MMPAVTHASVMAALWKIGAVQTPATGTGFMTSLGLGDNGSGSGSSSSSSSSWTMAQLAAELRELKVQLLQKDATIMYLKRKLLGPQGLID
eukprot:jgi/Chrzof1/6704/Cz19g06080.t1